MKSRADALNEHLTESDNNYAQFGNDCMNMAMEYFMKGFQGEDLVNALTDSGYDINDAERAAREVERMDALNYKESDTMNPVMDSLTGIIKTMRHVANVLQSALKRR